MLSAFLIIVGMLGGWWMFRLSSEHYDFAALAYGFMGGVWAFACLGIAANLAFK